MYALSNNIERIAEDHENARVIARALAAMKWAQLDPDDVVTNIIYFRTPGKDAAGVAEALARQGILSGATAVDQVRFVTHIDVSREDTQEIVRKLEKVKVKASGVPRRLARGPGPHWLRYAQASKSGIAAMRTAVRAQPSATPATTSKT